MGLMLRDEAREEGGEGRVEVMGCLDELATDDEGSESDDGSCLRATMGESELEGEGEG